ncbi:P-type Cu+ transporter, partial [Candidatus Hakubella thermalkaliphila]
SIKGMTCQDCANKIEKELASLNGIEEASVSFVTAQAIVKYNPEAIEVTAIKKVFTSLGYAVTETRGSVTDAFEYKYKETARVFSVGILLLSSWLIHLLTGIPPVITDSMALAAIMIGGYPIASKAIKALIKRELNVDALVAIAASAAIAIGDYTEAGLVIFILLLGEFLESVTLARTTRAIKGLASLIPDTVKLKRGDLEVDVPSSEIKVGDVVVVRSGEHIAIDGVIVKGDATIDQSLITGESIPVERSSGDDVYSGTINKVGAVEIKATKVGRDTTVARIERMITEAQGRKAPVERTVDRFAKYFVPAILILSAIVFLATGDVRRAITVLIVACPCALVLGTPTAVVAAIGAAARRGILIKGGGALEAVGRVNGVIFDKTGTLTYGAPKVVAIKEVCGHKEEDIVQLAAVAEKFSEHPLAGAILDKAGEWELIIAAPDDFKVKKGQGIEVKHNGMHIVVGNRSLLRDNNIALSAAADEYMKDRERLGETALIVAHGTDKCNDICASDTHMPDAHIKDDFCCSKEVCGVISLSDTLRESSAEAIQSLRSGRIAIIALYTGDNLRTASAIARRLGIEEVAAGLLPEDKVNKIKALMEQGNTIAMVGDGINDAPALATADIGIAMGVVGSDIAVQAANIAILNDDILSVPKVINLGRKALSVIRQNLFFALVFNTVMIALASQGFISMIAAAVFHQTSSLMVILNSMRLLRWKRRF